MGHQPGEYLIMKEYTLNYPFKALSIWFGLFFFAFASAISITIIFVEIIVILFANSLKVSFLWLFGLTVTLFIAWQAFQMLRALLFKSTIILRFDKGILEIKTIVKKYIIEKDMIQRIFSTDRLIANSDLRLFIWWKEPGKKHYRFKAILRFLELIKVYSEINEIFVYPMINYSQTEGEPSSLEEELRQFLPEDKWERGTKTEYHF